MSGNPNPTLSDVEEGDRVSDGPDAWSVKATDDPAGHILLERHDGETIPFAPQALGRCSCGVLMIGGPPCYGCYLKSEAAPAAAGGGGRG